jgi:signal transduction histidine kinase
VAVELRAGGEVVGELLVALPAGTRRLPPSTRVVVQLLAGPLGQAARATRLAEELRASRARVVAALEEERRRVRRDLHDGLGPTLTGIAYSADAAANLLRSDPELATTVLGGLRADAADAIAEVRRIVHGLRPRALDEFGLVEAVRQQVGRLHAADGRRLRVRVSAPQVLPDLPAVIEVVAYRVAVEAVTNAARHAGVDEVDVGFAVDGGSLEVEVRDGGPRRQAWTPGIGIGAMRERVEEVGGELYAGVAVDGGLVRARIPLEAPTAPGS